MQKFNETQAELKWRIWRTSAAVAEAARCSVSLKISLPLKFTQSFEFTPLI